MSNNTHDCSSIEQRINEHNLYISTIQDQFNKIDPQDPDAQNERDALNIKLNSLHGQVDMLQQALEDCRQGKGTDFPTVEIAPE
jgi:chromosome segregation ATPase